MELRETLIGLAVFGVVLGFALYQDRRPWQPGKRDWVPLMIVALIGLLVLAGHLVGLLRGS